MRRHAIWNEKTGSLSFVDNPDFDGDWQGRYGGTWDTIAAYPIDGEACGIPYNEELASIDGMRFYLFPPVGTPKETIDAAKRQIRNDRDVVGLKVFTPR